MIENIINLVNEFKHLLESKNVDKIEEWIEKASNLKIRKIDKFVNGLKRDVQAVRNAIIYEYNNGLAEGFVNTMKKDSDNFRQSAILDVMQILRKYGIEIIIYEPELKENSFYNLKVITDINQFKQKSDLILTNRMHEELKDVKEKVYTRDLYQRD